MENFLHIPDDNPIPEALKANHIEDFNQAIKDLGESIGDIGPPIDESIIAGFTFKGSSAQDFKRRMDELECRLNEQGPRIADPLPSLLSEPSKPFVPKEPEPQPESEPKPSITQRIGQVLVTLGNKLKE